mgnify:CR=1 FL=1
MKRSEVRVAELITPTVEALGLTLWGVENLTQGKFSLLRVYIEKEEGVSIEDCEKVSRQLSALLDVENPISGEYTLEVSSPGLERPLFKLEQFQLFIGDTVRIRTRGPIQGRRKFKGTIVEVAGDIVVVEIDGNNYNLPHADIEKATIVY